MREAALTLAWQGSVLLALGLVLSLFAKRRPARGHGLLVLAAVGAAAAPLLTVLFDALGWGMFAARGLSTRGLNETPVLDSFALPGTIVTWWNWGAWVWLGASTLLTARIAFAFARGRRLVRAADPLDDDRTGRIVGSARSRVGVRTPVTLRTSDAVRSPVVWCWGHGPIVVLPAHAPAPSPGVVCHELAHWRRRDHLSGLLGEALVAAMPWNPLAWAARRRLNELAERACDAWALSSGEAPADYAESLLGLVPARVGLLAPGMAGPGGLRRRVRAILGRPAAPTMGRRWVAVSGVLAFGAVATLALAQRRPLDTHAHHPTPDAMPATGWGEAKMPVVVSPAELDLGVVGMGCTGYGQAWVVNTGDEPAVLLGVEPGCGCTEVSGFEPGQVILPGGAIRLDVLMTAPELAGEAQTRYLVVKVKGQPTVKLPVRIQTDAGDC